jgi:hypothetical protein
MPVETMPCEQLRERVASGQALDADLLAHARDCDACRAVVADGGEVARRLVAATVLEQASAVDGRVHAQLERARLRVSHERGPAAVLRALPFGARLGVALTALLGATAALHRLHPQVPLSELTSHVLVFVAASAVLLWPLDRVQPGSGRLIAAALALLLPLGFAIFVSSRANDGASAAPWACLALGTALSLSFLALLRALDRRAGLGAERMLLVGGLAGVAGNALLHLHCPVHALVHLLVGHAMLGLLAAVAAYGLARVAARS